MKKIKMGLCVLVSVSAFILNALGRPILQPEVREYVPLEGSFSIAGLKVFYQDQTQCKIGAEDILGAGNCVVWDAKGIERDGIYVAEVSSPLGKALVKKYKMTVPQKPQGYAILAQGRKVAIVGNDSLGALYGCMTFRQMSEGGKVSAASVSDWPDFLYRGNVSLGRGLWNLGNGENIVDRFKAIKYGVDELMRHKINLVGDIFRITKGTDERSLELWRDLFSYLRDRGFKVKVYCSATLWSRNNRPEGVTIENWHCVTGHRSYYDHYYCWSDDKTTEDAAERFALHLNKIGVGDNVILTYHPVDGGGLSDPEEWSRRCKECKKRWKDDERWKASANQMNIWNRVIKKHFPNISFGSCVYPYWISALRTPEEKRTPLWKQNVIDYWQKLDGTIEDKSFWFSGWIAAKKYFNEFRKYVPSRPYAYGDTYPLSSGIFGTFHRKIGSMFESGMERAQVSSTDNRARYESCFLAAEYMWNTKAPGAEEYDGIVYYNPLEDHTGPEFIMTNSLPRICHTFWGKDIAPYMVKVFSSGVLPEYIYNPIGEVKYWNKLLSDPDYDPGTSHGKKEKKEGPRFVDTPEFMYNQCLAAEKCAKALEAALPYVESLPKYKKKYFMHFHRNAARWAACARAQFALRDAMRRLEKDSCEGVVKYLKAAREKCESEYKAIEASFSEKEKETSTGQTMPSARVHWYAKHWLEEFDAMIALVSARGDDDCLPKEDFVPGVTSDEKLPWTNIKVETWNGDKIVDKPVNLSHTRLVVEKGSKILFRGNGRIDIRYGEMYADGAKFEAEGVLTNDYRIKVGGGKLMLRNSEFKNLKCVNPGRARWFTGAVCGDGGKGSVVEGCLFVDSDALSFVNHKNALVKGNRFERQSVGLFFLNGGENRVERNLFKENSSWDVNISHSIETTVLNNRFMQGALGIRLYYPTFSKIAGNNFNKMKWGVQVWGADKTLLLGNIYKDCSKDVFPRNMDGKSYIRKF
jgi:hypothetical protein